ncbi:hypothetical protein MN608_08540 [Microdochium nivale]|nr:hypothetical protein MN608_08540 [Microdochium nivale]
MGSSHKTPKDPKPSGSSRSHTTKSTRSSGGSSKTQSSTTSSSSLHDASHASVHDTASHFSTNQSTSSQGHLPTVEHTVLTQESSVSSDYHPYQAVNGQNYPYNHPPYVAGQSFCTNPHCHDPNCYTHAHASTLQGYYLLGVGAHSGNATQEIEYDDSLDVDENEHQPPHHERRRQH